MTVGSKRCQGFLLPCKTSPGLLVKPSLRHAHTLWEHALNKWLLSDTVWCGIFNLAYSKALFPMVLGVCASAGRAHNVQRGNLHQPSLQRYETVPAERHPAAALQTGTHTHTQTHTHTHTPTHFDKWFSFVAHLVSFHFSFFTHTLFPVSCVRCEPVVYRRSAGPAECRGRLQRWLWRGDQHGRIRRWGGLRRR